MWLAFGGRDGDALSVVFALSLGLAILALLVPCLIVLLVGVASLPEGRRLIPTGSGMLLSLTATSLIGWLVVVRYGGSYGLFGCCLLMTAPPLALGLMPILLQRERA